MTKQHKHYEAAFKLKVARGGHFAPIETGRDCYPICVVARCT